MQSANLEFAAKKKRKNCVKSYPCGDSCISKSKNCRKVLKGQASNYANWLERQRQKLSSPKSPTLKAGKDSKIPSDKEINNQPRLQSLGEMAQKGVDLDRQMLDYEKGELKFYQDWLDGSINDLRKAQSAKSRAKTPEAKQKQQELIDGIKEERKMLRDTVKEFKRRIEDRENKLSGKQSVEPKKTGKELSKELEKEITKRLGDEFNKIAVKKRSPKNIQSLMDGLRKANLDIDVNIARSDNTLLGFAKNFLKINGRELRNVNEEIRFAKQQIKEAKNSRSKASREKKLAAAKQTKEKIIKERNKLRAEIKELEAEVKKRKAEIDKNTPKSNIKPFNRPTKDQIAIMKELRSRVRKEIVDEKQIREQLEAEIKKRDIRKGDLLSTREDQEILDELSKRRLEISAKKFDPNSNESPEVVELRRIKDETDDAAAEAISKIDGSPRAYDTLSQPKKEVYDSLVNEIKANEDLIESYEARLKNNQDKKKKKTINNVIKQLKRDKDKAEQELDKKRKEWNVE